MLTILIEAKMGADVWYCGFVTMSDAFRVTHLIHFVTINTMTSAALILFISEHTATVWRQLTLSKHTFQSNWFMLLVMAFINKPYVIEMEKHKGKPKCLGEQSLACQTAVRLNQEVRLIIQCRETFCSIWVNHANIRVNVGIFRSHWCEDGYFQISI